MDCGAIEMFIQKLRETIFMRQLVFETLTNRERCFFSLCFDSQPINLNWRTLTMFVSIWSKYCFIWSQLTGIGFFLDLNVCRRLINFYWKWTVMSTPTESYHFWFSFFTNSVRQNQWPHLVFGWIEYPKKTRNFSSNKCAHIFANIWICMQWYCWTVHITKVQKK